MEVNTWSLTRCSRGKLSQVACSDAVFNTYNSQRHLIHRSTFRHLIREAMASWEAAICMTTTFRCANTGWAREIQQTEALKAVAELVTSYFQLLVLSVDQLGRVFYTSSYGM